MIDSIQHYEQFAVQFRFSKQWLVVHLYNVSHFSKHILITIVYSFVYKCPFVYFLFWLFLLKYLLTLLSNIVF